MKPILFNTEMVRAVLDGRKTVARRVVKPRYCDSVFEMFRGQLCEASPDKPPVDNGDGTTTRFVRQFVPCKPPCCPGDILYVRETWSFEPCSGTCENACDTDAPDFYKGYEGCFVYRSDYSKTDDGPFLPSLFKWRPSIHMPKEAARLFLRVTGVRAERLQDITDAEAQKEGAADRENLRRIWNNCYSKPHPVKDKHGVIDHYESYPWEDVMETRTFRGKPWYIIGNPWVWVIEFERISREDAGNDSTGSD